MRLGYVVVNDILLDSEFYSDYDRAPLAVQRKVDSTIDKILQLKRFPSGFGAHIAHDSILNIGYISRSKSHWRILFTYDQETGMAEFCRLVKHEDMDRLI